VSAPWVLRVCSVRSEMTLCCFAMGMAKVKRSGVRGVDVMLPASLGLGLMTSDALRLLGVRRRKPDMVEVKDRLDDKDGVRELFGAVDDGRRWCRDDSK
jgi:hypothetical protein